VNVDHSYTRRYSEADNGKVHVLQEAINMPDVKPASGLYF